MSREICYGKQFISLGDGRYIPIWLHGSSNCTMFHGGREILERGWSIFLNNDTFAKTEEEIYSIMQKNIEESTPDAEWFTEGNKWVTTADIMDWLKNGIKNARTLDEILFFYPYQNIHCYVWYPDKEEGYLAYDLEKYCHSSAEILEWVKSFEEFESDYKKTPAMEFSGIESLKLGRKFNKPNVPVMMKIKDGFLCEYSDRGYSYCKDKSKAIIFPTVKEAMEKIGNCGCHPVGTFIEAKIDKVIEKNFVIGMSRGFYVSDKTSKRKLYSTGYIDWAKRFKSEKEAKKYIEEKLYWYNGELKPVLAK